MKHSERLHALKVGLAPILAVALAFASGCQKRHPAKPSDAPLPAAAVDTPEAPAENAGVQPQPGSEEAGAIGPVVGAQEVYFEYQKLAKTSGIDSALDKLETIQDRELARAASMGVVDVWTATAPEDAARWAWSSARVDDVLHRVLQNWVKRDAKAAGAWIAAQQPSAQTNVAIESYAQLASALDLDSAKSWIEEIPYSAGKRGAVQSLLRDYGDASPEEFLDWAMSALPPNEFIVVARDSIEGWKLPDPKAQELRKKYMN